MLFLEIPKTRRKKRREFYSLKLIEVSVSNVHQNKEVISQAHSIRIYIKRLCSHSNPFNKNLHAKRLCYRKHEKLMSAFSHYVLHLRERENSNTRIHIIIYFQEFTWEADDCCIRWRRLEVDWTVWEIWSATRALAVPSLLLLPVVEAAIFYSFASISEHALLLGIINDGPFHSQTQTA